MDRARPRRQEKEKREREKQDKEQEDAGWINEVYLKVTLQLIKCISDSQQYLKPLSEKKNEKDENILRYLNIYKKL